tara:strand:+ start:844 stop:1611 length:768 start_codon:yes stop_codon:yes gene_type:complete
MGGKEVELIILVCLLILLLLCIIVFVLFSVFMKRKNILLIESREAEKRFEREIAETQIEIREETLRNISWELHDNIGQLMTLAKIKAQNMQDAGNRESMLEVSETIGRGLTELRALSKSINPEAINNLSLVKAVTMEIERFNRLNFLEAHLTVTGEPISYDQKVEIVIFRIMQEFFTNTIKHSRASNLNVKIEFNQEGLFISAQDNGVGFENEIENYQGIGLTNMKKRAQLIQANVTIDSITGAGTRLRLDYKTL